MEMAHLRLHDMSRQVHHFARNLDARDVVEIVLLVADFISLYDVVGLDGLAGFVIDLLITDAVAGLLVDLMKADLFAFRGRRKHRDRTRHQRQAEIALPVGTRSHDNLYSNGALSRIGL